MAAPTAASMSSATIVDACVVVVAPPPGSLSNWGQNSGHVGVPLEAIPGFIQRLQALYAKTTGQQASAKSPGGKKSPGGLKGIGKGKKTKVVKVQKKEKQKPANMEDLDADLLNYTAARTTDSAVADAPPVVEAAP